VKEIFYSTRIELYELVHRIKRLNMKMWHLKVSRLRFRSSFRTFGSFIGLLASSFQLNKLPVTLIYAFIFHTNASSDGTTLKRAFKGRMSSVMLRRAW